MQQPQVSLRHMNALAKKLKQRRADAGALSLASPEVKFQLDTDTQDPLDVGMYQVRTIQHAHAATAIQPLQYSRAPALF
jgi:exoribonuclease R